MSLSKAFFLGINFLFNLTRLRKAQPDNFPELKIYKIKFYLFFTLN